MLHTVRYTLCVLNQPLEMVTVPLELFALISLRKHFLQQLPGIFLEGILSQGVLSQFLVDSVCEGDK